MTQQEKYWKELAESYLKTIKEINHQCGTANLSSFNQIKDAVASAIELSDEAMSNVPEPPAPAQGVEDSTSGFIGDKKIGSKWVIHDCINGHQFEIGTIVTIIGVDEEDYYATDGKNSWFVRDNELSHINGIK